MAVRLKDHARPSRPLHAAQRRYIAEDLVRLRRSDEQRRYAAPQRAARIDANPHQVDAVIFALARLREGGCILADEVGLGKTIEAGLVLSQLMAEGARRILLVTPKPLLGQWRQELYQLFSIDTVEAEAAVGAFDGDGVFLLGREAAGSVKGRDALLLTEPFDVCVIDEAHEVFAGIYKRFNKYGEYQEEATDAQTAGRFREVLSTTGTPVLLLTATPMQNNLLELWGLVQYVDPLGTLLGDLATFREVFCGTDERHLALGQDEELRSRLRSVIKRTLRRDAQEFLEKPFVAREARLFEYTMSNDEKALYDDVTRYLLEPGILAFQGRHRQLLLLNFHKRMASSTRALAVSLERVASRLKSMVRDGETPAESPEVTDFAKDLEESAAVPSLGASTEEEATRPNPVALNKELERVQAYVDRAHNLGPDDGKFRALLQAFRFVTERAAAAQGQGKLVIFTESVVTQGYLRDRLVETRMVTDAEITLFSGTNDSARAREALERWRQEVPQPEGTKMNRDIATRLALVHEFKSRTRVFISTEAGAKGLNLQFCDSVVNYDLPWNPQRIEQRIGRCHRYGQQCGVTVINFIAKDNVAQALTFEILSQKLELFGTVLDASDQVLHRATGNLRGEVLVSVLGSDFESELQRIYERSRTIDEVTAELRELRDKVAEERRRFEEAHARTAGLIEQRFEEGVQHVFRQHKEGVPVALAELDRDLEAVVRGYLDAESFEYTINAIAGERLLHVNAADRLPSTLSNGFTVAIGDSKEHSALSLNSLLVELAVTDARKAPRRMSAIVTLPGAHDPFRDLSTRRGRLRLMKLAFDGFERTELLVPVLVNQNGDLLSEDAANAVLGSPMRTPNAPLEPAVTDGVMDDATDEALFAIQSSVDAKEQARFERAVQQADRYIEDRLLVLKRRRNRIEETVSEARQRRDAAVGSEGRSAAEQKLLKIELSLEEVRAAIERLENRDDETFQKYNDHIHRRRYAPPRVEQLFDLDLEVECPE